MAKVYLSDLWKNQTVYLTACETGYFEDGSVEVELTGHNFERMADALAWVDRNQKRYTKLRVVQAKVSMAHPPEDLARDFSSRRESS